MSSDSGPTETSNLDPKEINTLLQNEKLRLDITNTKRFRSTEWVFKLISVVPSLVAIGGLLITTNQFLTQQRTGMIEQNLRSKAQSEDSRREFMRPLLAKRLEIYLEASEQAAKLATSQDPKIRQIAHDRFYLLYYGPMVFVEDKDVSEAMVKFNNNQDLKHSLALASALRKSYFRSLRFTPEEWQKEQEDYAADSARMNSDFVEFPSPGR